MKEKIGGIHLVYVMIFFSLFISAIGSVAILKKTEHKVWSMVSAVFVNIIILLSTMFIMYNMNEEARIFGVDDSESLTLIIAIPIISWVNFVLLQFVNKNGRQVN
ncbi:hypothetical protein NCCP2222_03870 [Sporosarcina sp. NCCP-2222]|nr:hypothetical protein NCCP2222_03870 [Sporosarcina sp. NCCP-2222]